MSCASCSAWPACRSMSVSCVGGWPVAAARHSSHEPTIAASWASGSSADVGAGASWTAVAAGAAARMRCAMSRSADAECAGLKPASAPKAICSRVSASFACIHVSIVADGRVSTEVARALRDSGSPPPAVARLWSPGSLRPLPLSGPMFYDRGARFACWFNVRRPAKSTGSFRRNGGTQADRKARPNGARFLFWRRPLCKPCQRGDQTEYSLE